MFYGAAVWDPWLIVAQIVCLQCLYYLTLSLFLALLVGIRISKMSLFYLFDYAAVTTSTVTGWCVIVSFLLTSLAGAGYLLYLIERTKKVLRFLCNPLYHSSFHLHCIWGMAFLVYMVDSEYCWTGSDGFARRTSVYET